MANKYRIPLKHKLPLSDRIEDGNGKWFTREWKAKTKAAALANHTRLATEEEYEKWKRGF